VSLDSGQVNFICLKLVVLLICQNVVQMALCLSVLLKCRKGLCIVVAVFAINYVLVVVSHGQMLEPELLNFYEWAFQKEGRPRTLWSRASALGVGPTIALVQGLIGCWASTYLSLSVKPYLYKSAI